jgi:chromosome segregation ATPase
MFRRILWKAASLSVLGIVGGLAAIAGADESPAKAHIIRLLDTGWGNSFRAIEPAQGHYETAKAAAPRDPRPAYAFALVHIKHRRYGDAVKLLDEALASDSRHLPTREAKLWTTMLQKNYAAALVQMEQLAAALPQEEAGKPSDAEQQRETARYLGRLLAFLEGPAAKSADVERVAASRKKVESRLSPTLQRELEAGYDTVADRFEGLHLARERTRDQAQAEQEKSKQREAERLTQERDTVAKEKKAVEQRALESREELDKFLSAIDRKLSPLDRELGRLTTRAAEVRDRMIDLDREITRILLLADSIDDPQLRLRYRLEADRLNASYSRYSADYRGLERQAASVRSEANALLNERDGAINRYNAEAKRLGREQVKLGGREKRLARDEDRNRKTPSGNTDRVRILSDKVTAFTTYEPFPLEEAKARLLESLR